MWAQSQVRAWCPAESQTAVDSSPPPALPQWEVAISQPKVTNPNHRMVHHVVTLPLSHSRPLACTRHWTLTGDPLIPALCTLALSPSPPNNQVQTALPTHIQLGSVSRPQIQPRLFPYPCATIAASLQRWVGMALTGTMLLPAAEPAKALTPPLP